METLFFITQSTIPVIGDLAKLFGILMNGIYDFFGDTFGFYSLGLSIVIFTIITRLLMLPLAFKQQKSMKEMQVIQPEIQKIQSKYKDKKDQESQRKMQAEMTALYQQHGVNPLGGCLPLLIQMPIIFSLFQVLRNIPAYIGSIGDKYYEIVNHVASVDGYVAKIDSLRDVEAFKSIFTQLGKAFDPTVPENLVNFLYKFQSSTWDSFYSVFSTIEHSVDPIVVELNKIYYMFGINLADKPDLMSIGILIPVLNVVAQYGITRLSMNNNSNSGNAQMNQTNKTMMNVMPLMSGFFALTMPAGLGLYWLIGSLFQLVQQLVINKHIHNDLDKKKK